VLSIEPNGVEDVYDCAVEEVHEFDANGLQVHNCGEIILSVWGGYCTIGDICLAHVENLDEARDAASLLPQFLIRTNTMPFLYEAEVRRTNRIGIGATGIHEFAYKHFGHTFYDLLNEEISADFWHFMAEMRGLAEKGAREYAQRRGLTIPHTVTCCKPSGTVSKVMACTEGAHLSSYDYYVRWVQYPKNSPEVEEHVRRGYPMKDVSHQYAGHVVIGFPTKMPIVELMGDKVVLAGEAIPEEQYQWLRLLEKYWLGEGTNNSISYTLKYDPKAVRYEEFMAIILKNQKTVRACAIMPQDEGDLSAYAYTPEERVSQEVYEAMVAEIQALDIEGYDEMHLICDTGGCPLELDLSKSNGKMNGGVASAETTPLELG
jgi:hypothetical protein